MFFLYNPALCACFCACFLKDFAHWGLSLSLSLCISLSIHPSIPPSIHGKETGGSNRGSISWHQGVGSAQTAKALVALVGHPLQSEMQLVPAAKRPSISCRCHNSSLALLPRYCAYSLWYCQMCVSRASPSLYVTAVAVAKVQAQKITP